MPIASVLNRLSALIFPRSGICGNSKFPKRVAPSYIHSENGPGNFKPRTVEEYVDAVATSRKRYVELAARKKNSQIDPQYRNPTLRPETFGLLPRKRVLWGYCFRHISIPVLDLSVKYCLNIGNTTLDSVLWRNMYARQIWSTIIFDILSEPISRRYGAKQ